MQHVEALDKQINIPRGGLPFFLRARGCVPDICETTIPLAGLVSPFSDDTPCARRGRETITASLLSHASPSYGGAPPIRTKLVLESVVFGPLSFLLLL